MEVCTCNASVERQRQVDSRGLTGQSIRSRPIRPVRDPILKKRKSRSQDEWCLKNDTWEFDPWPTRTLACTFILIYTNTHMLIHAWGKVMLTGCLLMSMSYIMCLCPLGWMMSPSCFPSSHHLWVFNTSPLTTAGVYFMYFICQHEKSWGTQILVQTSRSRSICVCWRWS